MVRGLAALQGKSLADIAKRAKVHPSVFYRVVRGERTSKRLERFIARELGVTVATLRRVGKAVK